MSSRGHITLLTLFASLLLASCAAAAAEGPLVTIGQTPAAPLLDGRLGATEWAAASGPAAFVDLSTGLLAPAQPQAWLMWDAQNLYIALRAPLPSRKEPVARIREADGNLWEDDALEVFLAPTPGGAYYQLIVNSLGTLWDSTGRDPAWTSGAQVATDATRDSWSAEIALPFAALGVEAPTPGAVWGLNVAWDRQTPAPLNATWAHLKGALHDPAGFGALVFAAAAPVAQIAQMLNPDDGKVGLSGTWSAQSPASADLSLTHESLPAITAGALLAGGGKAASLRLESRLPREGGFAVPGRYEITFTVQQGDDTVFRACAPFVVRKPLDVSLVKLPLARTLEVRVDPTGLDRDPALTGLKATLCNEAGKSVASRRFPLGGRSETRSLTFDTSSLAPGAYRAQVSAHDILGRLIHQEEAPFTVEAIPAWVGSTAGVSTDLLAPWTPVEASPESVKVWGREYQVGPLPFPAAVTTADASILAGPISLSLTTDGKEQAWRATGPARIVSATPDRACLETSAVGEGVRCEGQMATEYDGMVRSDFTLSFPRARQIDQLSLVIPLKEAYARYLYHFPGQWGSAYNAGALPAEGFTAGFRPYVWLGDESRGLAWFCESPETFTITDPERVTEISRASGIVTLRINLVQAPRGVSGPLKFTFGFQATPVKPLQPDAWDYRICHEGGYGIQDLPWARPATVTYPARGSINLAQGTFEAWVKPHFDPNIAVAPDDPGRGIHNRSLFAVNLPGGNQVGFYWNIDDRGMRVYYKRGNTHPLVLGSHARWQPDEWHHVAFTWGDKTRIYLDGVLAAEADYQGTLPGLEPDDESTICLGYGTGDPCEFTVDEARISDIPRESFDIQAPRALDEHTLLLERFETAPAAAGQTPVSPEKGAAGKVVGATQRNGIWGYGYALFSEGADMTRLDRLAELGVRTICFHEHWTDIQNYTSTTHGEQLHALVKACHERGVKLLLYFGYELSNIAPEFADYAPECLVEPRGGLYTRQPPQTAYIVCYQSKWQDFMADGIARVMDEYDIDGVYLDGTAYPWGCGNTLHGCGHPQPDGTVGSTWPIFAYRDMMRRIYTIVKSRKPEGEVNVHNSTMLVAPTLAWATSTWDGEQFGGLPRSKDPMKVIPLEAFRAEFMGRQLGVPAEFLCYEQPYTYRQAMAFTLLHDVLVRGSLGPNLELESALWKGMEDFGRQGSVWMPYWEPRGYVQTGPDDSIKASLYSRAEAGAVIVVSNLGGEPRTALVRLDLAGLALPDRVKAVDMVTGSAVTITEEGRLAFGLEPLDFRVIRITPR